MSALLFTLTLLYTAYSSTVEVNSPSTINWINSGVSLPRYLENAIITYYQDYFIVFGGHYGDHTNLGLNTKIYIGYTHYTDAPAAQPTINPALPPYDQPAPSPTTSPTGKPTTDGTTAYPTQAPTARYGFKSITSWNSNHSIDNEETLTVKLPAFECVSQCYSTNYQATFFMPYQVNCYGDVFLYRFSPWNLIYNDEVQFIGYNLTKYFYNATEYDGGSGCKFANPIRNAQACVATNRDTFDQTQTVYIVLGDRIFIYNISDRTGYFSNNHFTTPTHYCDDNKFDENGNSWCGVTIQTFSLTRAACLIDTTGKYMWIAYNSNKYNGDKGMLWRYSIQDNEIIDVADYYYNVSTHDANVNGTLLRTVVETDCHCDGCCEPESKPYFFGNYESTNGKMVQLSDGFILFTGEKRDFIFLPNLTESNGWYPPSKTKYIDVACVGRRHDEIFDWVHRNTPINMWHYGPTENVLSFGGETYSNFRYEKQECTECDDGYSVNWVHTINYTDQIRYYAWRNDFELVVNFTEKILFGDNIIFNIYFEPTCDLSHYNVGEWVATQHNPLYIEIHITANEPSLNIDRYMYIINASEIIDDTRDYNWDRTYDKCFICLGDMDLYEEDWNDEEGILSSDDGCVLCSSGLETGKLSEQQAGVQYQLTFDMLKSPNNTVITLESRIHNLTISECEPGYGTTRGASNVDCNECPFNQFTLQNSLDPCIACTNVNDGLECQGGNQTELTYNYWVAAWDYKTNDLKPFYEIAEYDDNEQKNDAIVTALCPPKYCCQDVSGCDYLSQYLKKPESFTSYHGHGHFENDTWVWEYGYNDCNGTICKWKAYDDTSYYGTQTYWNITYESGRYEESSYQQRNWGSDDNDADIRANGLLCAFGRDVDIPLCGACLEGWAELLGTTQCGYCGYEGGSWTLIVWFAFILTMFLSWYIIFCDSKPIDYSQTITPKQLMIQDDLIGFQTLLFKPCLYYFQSLNPIIDTRGITLWLSPVLAFFNFSFDTVGGQANKICWSESLDACGEILINLLLPLMLMFNLFVPRCCINKKGYGSIPCCCCCKKKKICCCCCSNYQEPFFYSAFFRVLLIVIGVVLTVCFKYVTYVELQEKKLMFYSADKEAFGGWWFLGFFGIIFVLLSFAFIYWKIKKQNPDDRFSTTSPYRKFVKSFKMRFWYWEFVLFARRFFISFFTSVQFVGGDYTNFIFLVILCIFFGLQIHYKPFAYQRVNKIESLNLILLISAFTAANFIRVNDEDVFVGWILSICILIPLVIIAIYFVKIIAHRMQWIRYKQDDDKIKVDKMLKRMPKSYRDMTTKEMGRTNNDDELEDYGDTNSDIKTIKINDDNRHSDDELKDIQVANVSPKSNQKVQMVQINNDSTEFNEGNNTLQEKETLHSTSKYISVAMNETEMKQQDEINDEEENILENELDVVMSQDTESIIDENQSNAPPMYNPNAQPVKQEGNDKVTNV